jgi:signal transduction histidine kinase
VAARLASTTTPGWRARSPRPSVDATRRQLERDLHDGAQQQLEDVEATAYCVVSEGLTNAARYALASVVHVAGEARDRSLRVSVRDEGPGGADPANGSGLLGLKDRVEASGGTMSLRSPPGEGTTLVVDLPLDNDP